MMKYCSMVCALLTVIFHNSCDERDGTREPMTLVVLRMGAIDLLSNPGTVTSNAPSNLPLMITFSSAINTHLVEDAIQLNHGNDLTPVELSFQDDDKTILINPVENLLTNTEYTLVIGDQLRGVNGEIFQTVTIKFKTAVGELKVSQWKIGADMNPANPIDNVPLTIDLEIRFSEPLDIQTMSAASVVLTGPVVSPLQFQFSDNNKVLAINSVNPLKDLRKYRLVINDKLKGSKEEIFNGFIIDFYTADDPTPKFPLISDDELLTKVQQQTFKYFWDFAHPVSGMARERNTSGDIVTSGGSGFGLMSIVVGIERNFITRQQGIERLDKILDFLETADRFHGAWPHWINGSTGKVVPFSAKDNGGDLVETSFLVQGLLTFRQYLNSANATEQALINRINTLWETVEWDWYRKNNENVLYWHWSPNFNWEMNFALSGYFEEQITYLLAAASPTHGIPKVVYTNGYGKNGAIVKNNTHYGYKLPLESPAPLFWVHYSYLGLDPHFSDDYANYWEQNVNATLINQAYCIANPKNFVGYSDECWGLTSSDNQSGYNAHSPGNDLGVITPTAALSSFPYTPEQSMKALKFFYYKIGDRLWGEYGFYDAFNLTEGWTANSYLAIDQGPIIIMIENYRTGLLWDLFMSAPEVQSGATELSFTY